VVPGRIKYSFLFCMTFLICALPVLAQEDQAYVRRILERSEDLRRADPDSAIYYGKKGLALAKKINYLKGIVSGNINTGMAFSSLNRNEEALPYMTTAITLAENSKDKMMTGDAYFYASQVYRFMSDQSMAIATCLDAMRQYEAVAHKPGISNCYNGIANIYYDQQNQSKALEYFLKTLSMEDVMTESNRSVVYMNVGLVYSDLKKFDSAMHYFSKSLLIRQKSGTELQLADIHTNMGICYSDMGNYPEALEHLLIAEKAYEAAGDRFHQEILFTNLGDVYILMKQYALGESYLLRGFEMAKQLKDVEGIKISYHTLSELYAARGDYRKAFLYNRRYMTIRDSLMNENQNMISEIQTKYETDKRDHEIELLSKDKLLQENIIRRQRTEEMAFTGGIALLLGILFFIIRGYRQKKKDHHTIMVQKNEVEKAKGLVEDKNKEILDSIHYARRIQRALLTNEKYVARNLERLKNNTGHREQAS
jgi:tetratricopeptide (TPR) repeat protein